MEISGKGNKSIIFIPGFGCSGDVWKETLTQFEDEYTCYVLTLPGFAGVKPETDPTIKDWVEEVAQYIQQKKIDKPVIIGHSLGGVMAQWLAASHPDMISKIVVVDAVPCLPALSNATFQANDNPDCSMYVNNFSAMDEKQFYRMQKIGMASMVTDTSKIELITQWSLKSDRVTLARVFCQLMNTDTRTLLTAVKCPALILLEPSFKSIETVVSEQYKNLKGVKMEYADKGLHFIMYDDKDWYIQQLKSFLQ